MPAGDRADAWHVVPLRLVFAIMLTALLACACAGIASALGAHAHRRARSHPAHCVRVIRFHSQGKRVVRRVPVRCRHRATRRPAHPRHRTAMHPRHVAAAHPRRRPGTTRRVGRRHTSAADVNGACSDTQLRPSAANVELVRAAVLCLVNRERAAHGESALVPNAALQSAAQSHTESMAFGDYFEHVGPGGDTPVARLRSAGYLTRSSGFEVGENIAWGTLWLGTPRAIVAAWMESPGHRANILDARFRDTAVGVSPHPPASLSHGLAGGVYTQDFAVIVRR
jgi:uncharacterized protein YkwD